MKQFFLFLKTLFSKKPQIKSPSVPLPPRPKAETKPLPETESHNKRLPKPPKKKWSINNFSVEPREGETRFHDFALPLSVMHAIADLKFEYCTPIQAKLMPHTLEGKDATAKAQTGTGKSASFIITILAAFIKKPFKNKKGSPRALILAPTRELVYQIEKDFKDLARYTNLKIVSIFGGTGYQKQQTQLKEKPVDIIVATPGRLIDFMSKGLINPSKVEIIVIDEADRMLDMGFIPDVRRIILKTPHKNKRQTLFFSATLTPDVLRLAQSWTTENKVQIEIDPDQAAADSIQQIVYISTETDKFKHVYNLINNEQLKRVILFVNRKDTARIVSEKLDRYGQKCSVLSGDISQDKRFKVLENFKNGRINILVATDVAARGLHIENISHVINYDLPHEPEHYIHRIGRTGRAGAKGISISFADEMSSFFIPKIEEVLGNKIVCEYPSEALDKPLPKPKKKYHSKSAVKKKKPFKGKHRPYRKHDSGRQYNKQGK
ncbi:ATP-dependent RNA helicase RhlB [Desulfobacula phenolica]|uniref:ATP-dependent RNA helicase RhlB n=1 Tax=Desulfobacula phenolica TaxID=90732 RepID=A0A1H2DX74_9BACT|nr:ATP-dependent RNA helicase RhlB [Desulfobacula phenolica]